MKDALVVLMDGNPNAVDYDEITKILLTIPGVKRVHGIRIWALSIDKIIVNAHLAMSK